MVRGWMPEMVSTLALTFERSVAPAPKPQTANVRAVTLGDRIRAARVKGAALAKVPEVLSTASPSSEKGAL